MSVEGKAKILRIFLNESTKLEDKPLYEAIVEKAFQMGLAGSMVFRGVEAFGFCCKFCRTLHPGLTDSKCHPMVIEFIDSEDKLNEVVPTIKQMMQTGAMIMQDAEILFNQGN